MDELERVLLGKEIVANEHARRGQSGRRAEAGQLGDEGKIRSIAEDGGCPKSSEASFGRRARRAATPSSNRLGSKLEHMRRVFRRGVDGLSSYCVQKGAEIERITS